VDINTHSEVILRNRGQPGPEEETVNTIVDSILTGKMPMTSIVSRGGIRVLSVLTQPVQSQNAPFETVEELLLVKGVTPRILYGGDKKKGLIHFITVQGKSNKVNLNAAPREVLLDVPGMTVAMAEAILIYRQEQEIKNIQEISGIFGDQQALILPFVTVASSTTFTIESMGFTKSKQAGYGLRATISLTGDNKSPCLYFKSPALLTEKDGGSE
jgi:general secretion pathway protein K